MKRTHPISKLSSGIDESCVIKFNFDYLDDEFVAHHLNDAFALSREIGLPRKMVVTLTRR
jgi:hypothetical protein